MGKTGEVRGKEPRKGEGHLSELLRHGFMVQGIGNHGNGTLALQIADCRSQRFQFADSVRNSFFLQFHCYSMVNSDRAT